MADIAFSADLECVAELRRTMELLPRKFLRRGTKAAFRSGARLVRNEMRSLAAPIGDISEDIDMVVAGSKRLYYTGNRKDVYAIAVKQPRSRLAHLFEFGTEIRRTKSGANRGRIKPQPFIRLPVITHGDRAIQLIMKEMWENLRFMVREFSAGNKPDLRKLRSGR